MDDLIEALTILRKYGNPGRPTNCAHDLLWVNIDPEKVTPEDTERLDQLGFFPDSEGAGFTSTKFGSC